MDISKIDTNFNLDTNLNVEGVNFYSALDSSFKTWGLMYTDDCYKRLPSDIAKNVNEGVFALHKNSAGGRLTFKTNSPYVMLSAEFDENQLGRMPHFAFTGSIGFDMYFKSSNEWIYAGTFIPPINITSHLKAKINLNDNSEKEILIHFPLYSTVKKLCIGLDEKATLKPFSPYKSNKPICFYGSSITQGGCASRPGNAYTNVVSRIMNYDTLNLGFSGSAKAEDAIAEYISKLDMSAFVFDYDHNAPTHAHLAETYERMFKIIRNANPNLPIIMLSRPKFHLNEEETERKKIIKRIYNAALKNGDKNVYFIPGDKLIQKKYAEFSSVDNIHPNDIGFFSMAEVLCKLLKKIGF